MKRFYKSIPFIIILAGSASSFAQTISSNNKLACSVFEAVITETDRNATHESLYCQIDHIVK